MRRNRGGESLERVDSRGSDAHRTRGTVPVTFELGDGREVVVPLRLLEAA